MSVLDVYVKKIIELVQECDDIQMLDIILKLLQKSG